MNRRLITFLILIAAILLYIAGLAMPATALIILGVIVEGMFWFRLFGSRRLSGLTLFGCKSLDGDQLSLSNSLNRPTILLIR
jgi:hypothetical protein